MDFWSIEDGLFVLCDFPVKLRCFMRSHRGWVQSPSDLREKSIGHLGKVHRAFGKSPSGILRSWGHFGEVQGPGGKARWTFQKTRWTFISWGCGGGFSHNGGANHELDSHHVELNVGSMRVGVASTVHVWAYCEDCSHHRKHHTLCEVYNRS